MNEWENSSPNLREPYKIKIRFGVKNGVIGVWLS